MKITLFTSNKKRHNYFINILTEVCDELFVIQESGTIFPGIVPDHYPASETLKKYFDRVNGAQNKFFGNSYIESSKKLNLLPILKGDLNKLSVKTLDPFLQSDLYIVFGSSFIKGDLINFLIKKKQLIFTWEFHLFIEEPIVIFGLCMMAIHIWLEQLFIY